MLVHSLSVYQKAIYKKGVSTELLLAAAVYAKAQGAELLEGYPVEPNVEQQIPAAFCLDWYFQSIH